MDCYCVSRLWGWEPELGPTGHAVCHKSHLPVASVPRTPNWKLSVAKISVIFYPCASSTCHGDTLAMSRTCG